MKIKNSIKKTAWIGFLLAGSMACSHGPVVQDFPDTASPSDEVSKLELDLSSAQNAQVDVLAPRSYREAWASLKDARASLDKQKNPRDTLHDVAVGRGYLKRANEVAQLSRSNMEDVVIARQEAVQAGAPAVAAKDFDTADERLLKMTSGIENGNLETAAEYRSAMQAEYRSLELRAIKDARLGHARQIIDQAVKEGAAELAPRTLALAEKSFKDTDAFIVANRHDAAQLKIRSSQARASADYLMKITLASRAGKKVSSEDTALMIENGRVQLEQKQAQLDTKQTQLTEERDVNDELAAANVSLEDKQAFDRRFELARAEFSQGEAEVYRQGNTLMIRLRGLEFPASQALLKGGDFPLLAKVQRVIEGFGKSSVVIEGHTDSRGTKALNEKLSEERAQAVKEYLVSNSGSVERPNIRTVGFGYQKPLASNKTVSGRAQNRRVDVLIQSF